MSNENYTQLKTAAQTGDLATIIRLLKNPVTAKIEERVLELALLNNHWDVCVFFQNRQNTSKHLMDCALYFTVDQSNLLFVQRLIPYSNVSHNNNRCAILAISKQDINILKFLLPHITQDTKLLPAAVRSGNMDILCSILKICDPKWECSAALQEAIAHQNQEMFDLLYPLSNPQEAWEVIRKDSWFDRNQRKMLKSRLDVDRQKSKLERAIAVSEQLPPTKKNKI